MPEITYNRDGDLLECIWGSGSYYGEWLDPRITLYRSHETGEVVGVCIEGASRLCGRPEASEAP
jgi:hypothetical protein